MNSSKLPKRVFNFSDSTQNGCDHANNFVIVQRNTGELGPPGEHGPWENSVREYYRPPLALSTCLSYCRGTAVQTSAVDGLAK